MMSFTIYALGDSAVTIDLGSVVDEAINKKILAMHRWLQLQNAPLIKEIRIAYSALSVYYDLLIVTALKEKHQSSFTFISRLLEESFIKSKVSEEPERIIKIPVCYHPDLGPDQEELMLQKKVTREILIERHVSRLYRVFMIGFLPGFPYLAEVDESIAINRKASPRPMVPKGSVGIAGRQTGIYPVDSPGGWQIIGRTPFRLFDPNHEGLVFIRPGDKVQFSEISLEEFHHLNN